MDNRRTVYVVVDESGMFQCVYAVKPSAEEMAKWLNGRVLEVELQ